MSLSRSYIELNIKPRNYRTSRRGGNGNEYLGFYNDCVVESGGQAFGFWDGRCPAQRGLLTPSRLGRRHLSKTTEAATDAFLLICDRFPVEVRERPDKDLFFGGGMGRRARKAPAEVESTGGELPELSALLGIMDRRSSPRRRDPGRFLGEKGEGDGVKIDNVFGSCLAGGNLTSSMINLPPPKTTTGYVQASASSRRSPSKSPIKADTAMKSPTKKAVSVKTKGGYHKTSAVSATSNNGTALQFQQQRPLRLAHVNSLLLPLNKVAPNDGNGDSDEDVFAAKKLIGSHSKENGDVGGRQETPALASNKYPNVVVHSALRRSPQRVAKKPASYSSRFVLREAECDDDDPSSTSQGDEDEFTDLSGFIVDDDAELSSYESESELTSPAHEKTRGRKAPATTPRRLLQRGPKLRPNASDEGEGAVAERRANRRVDTDFAKSFDKLSLGPNNRLSLEHTRIEVVDLTSPPPSPRAPNVQSSKPRDRPRKQVFGESSSSDINPSLSGSDALHQFSPPRRPCSPIKLPPRPDIAREPTTDVAEADRVRLTLRPQTPTTPPRSPTKLKSPSKLLSPSKRNAAIPRPLHRPSVDAFWSSEAVNDWNDQYSPRKAPPTSPRKRRLARFNIWSDSDCSDKDEGSKESSLISSDPPTPTTSPRKKSAAKALESPSKPSSPSKKQLAAERRSAAAARSSFLSTRADLASSLLHDLDTLVTSSRLAQLTATTGGVKLAWSKTLRSTAGRANWRRTVTNPSTAALDTSVQATGGNTGRPLFQHHASIELAEKILDSPERLANTVAHEFCHLANFMISGVSDQPHGASFKQWYATLL